MMRATSSQGLQDSFDTMLPGAMPVRPNVHAGRYHQSAEEQLGFGCCLVNACECVAEGVAAQSKPANLVSQGREASVLPWFSLQQLTGSSKLPLLNARLSGAFAQACN